MGDMSTIEDNMSNYSEIRPSPIAGKWYEGQPDRLRKNIDGFIENARRWDLKGELIGIVVPHAGHRYSGSVAGAAYSLLNGIAPDVVVILSPMHHLYPYPLITTIHSAYQTPLGEIRVDRKLINEINSILANRLGYGLTEVANDQEHSVEIELPFLQCILKNDFSLVPIMLRQQNKNSARHIGETLVEVLQGKKILLVASTDLSHFHNQSAANKMDKAMLDQIEAFSPEGIFQLEKDGEAEACGLGALAAVLWAAKAMGADQVRILDYATSGQVTGDYQSVVGYGSAGIFKTK